MKRFSITLLALLCLILSHAATTAIDLTLFSGTQECTDTWGGWQKIATDKCAQAAAGDEIIITVSAISPTSTYPQVALNNSSWAQLAGTSFVHVTQPGDVSFAVTDEMATEIKANGFIVKGAGYTFTAVTLRHYVTSTGSTAKDNTTTTVWSGSQPISWNTGGSWVTVDKSLFATAQVGHRLRLNVTALGISAVGRVLSGNWQAFAGIGNVSPLTGDYYEYEITETMLADLQSQGLIVSGVDYSLTSVELIDPANRYNVYAQASDADIKAWNAGETPKLSTTITNAEATEVTVPYTVNLYRDMVDDATQTHSLYQTYATDVTLAPGETKTVELDFEQLTTPGFYRMNAAVNGNAVCSYIIGYDPTHIVSPADAQPDFWTYWDKAKAQLNSIDPNFTIVEEMTAYSTASRKVYKVSMQSVPDAPGESPMTIYGYYAEPVAAGTYPAIVYFQGTDNGTGTLAAPMSGDSNPTWVELTISTRGQQLGRDDKYGYDFYSYQWGDTARHYYRGAYLDCLRAVQCVQARAKVDSKLVFGAGGSQGGCFAYIAAALSGTMAGIAPAITGHADFTDGMKIVNWPRAKFLAAQSALGMTDAERDAFNSYYDTMNFASRITCPVITNFSLQDTTDPPHTNIAPYNLLTGVADADKAYSINSFKGHASADDWKTTYMAFFSKYLPAGTTTTLPTVSYQGQSLATGTYDQLLHCTENVTVSADAGITLYAAWGSYGQYATADDLIAVATSKVNGTSKNFSTTYADRTLYAVGVDGNGNKSELVTIRFTNITYPVTIGATGWASFSAPYNHLDFTLTGLTAYIVTAATATQVVLEPTATAPKGTGLLLNGVPGTYYIPQLTAATSLPGNLLVGTNAADYTTVAGDCYLGLNPITGVTGMVQSNGGKTVARNKAYLPAAQAVGAKGFLALGDETTGVADVQSALPSASKCYNLTGQPVDAKTKGVVISRNKKYINR